jgi:uncharacterized membrane protein
MPQKFFQDGASCRCHHAHEQKAQDDMTTPDPTQKARILLGAAFTGAGIAHVVTNEWFEQLVPESLAQWRRPISAITAVIQFVGGISMFIPRLRALARWVNLTMLVGSLPAAADQIRHPDALRRAGVPPELAPVRVVVQTLVAAATWWATSPSRSKPPVSKGVGGVPPYARRRTHKRTSAVRPQ